MPPKKKDEDIDLASLPPWLPIIINLKFNTQKERTEYIVDRFQKILKD